MSDLRDALQDILSHCIRSRRYGRRVQVIHETAMVALGLTANQRQIRHDRAMRNAEEYAAKVREGGYRNAKEVNRRIQAEA